LPPSRKATLALSRVSATVPEVIWLALSPVNPAPVAVTEPEMVTFVPLLVIRSAPER